MCISTLELDYTMISYQHDIQRTFIVSTNKESQNTYRNDKCIQSIYKIYTNCPSYTHILLQIARYVMYTWIMITTFHFHYLSTNVSYHVYNPEIQFKDQLHWRPAPVVTIMFIIPV